MNGGSDSNLTTITTVTVFFFFKLFICVFISAINIFECKIITGLPSRAAGDAVTKQPTAANDQEQ